RAAVHAKVSEGSLAGAGGEGRRDGHSSQSGAGVRPGVDGLPGVAPRRRPVALPPGRLPLGVTPEKSARPASPPAKAAEPGRRSYRPAGRLPAIARMDGFSVPRVANAPYGSLPSL